MNYSPIISAILFILVILLGGLYFFVHQENRVLEEELSEVTEQKNRLEARVSELQQELEQTEEEHDAPVSTFRPLSDYELRRFEQKGISDPVSFLRDELQDRPDLIPAEAVLGGTMHFYDREAIHIISDRWVFAEYEDGHVMGQVLLSYHIDEDRTVNWEVIAVSEPG